MQVKLWIYEIKEQNVNEIRADERLKRTILNGKYPLETAEMILIRSLGAEKSTFN